MLHITVGTSGSGKSFFCKNKLLKPDSIYLSSDFCRSVLGKDESDQSVSHAVFPFLETSALYFLKQGKDVIVDATFLTKKFRKNFIDIARNSNTKIAAYYFDVPIEVCKERNAKRERKVPESVINRQFSRIVCPYLDEVDFLNVVNQDGEVMTEGMTKYA
jgi:predicted kinase